LTGQSTIRDVLLFPQMRSLSGDARQIELGVQLSEAHGSTDDSS